MIELSFTCGAFPILYGISSGILYGISFGILAQRIET